MSDMVFDRTQEDVYEAILIRSEKVAFDPVTLQPTNLDELTPEDINYLEKGTITINTLNRIEQKQEDLNGILNDLGYYNTNIINKSWNYTDIFNATEFQRIVDNDRILREAFFTYSGTPETPAAIYYYENINAVEKILFDIDVMINDIKSRYRQCGGFVCGED